jgi:hypothetical protein
VIPATVVSYQLAKSHYASWNVVWRCALLQVSLACGCWYQAVREQADARGPRMSCDLHISAHACDPDLCYAQHVLTDLKCTHGGSSCFGMPCQSGCCFLNRHGQGIIQTVHFTSNASTCWLLLLCCFCCSAINGLVC